MDVRIRTKKKPRTYKFHPDTIELIESLGAAQKITNTEIIERAVQYYSKRRK